MEMILTGNRINAEDAEKLGLISRVFPADQLIDETIKIAEQIANYSSISTQLAKEATNLGKNLVYFLLDHLMTCASMFRLFLHLLAFETTLLQGERCASHISNITIALVRRKKRKRQNDLFLNFRSKTKKRSFPIDFVSSRE